VKHIVVHGAISIFKENKPRSKLTQDFDKHCKTKRHKHNVERHRFNLQTNILNNLESTKEKDSNSKIEPFLDLNDDNLTSISSTKSLSLLYKLDENYNVITNINYINYIFI
jgi:hypothetical protein